jgi:hypothetical protein
MTSNKRLVFYVIINAVVQVVKLPLHHWLFAVLCSWLLQLPLHFTLFLLKICPKFVYRLGYNYALTYANINSLGLNN